MLSTVFCELPDMLINHILELVGGEDIYVLGYNRKTKTITTIMNKAYMKKALEYKLNNPPVMITSSRYNIQYIRFTPPPKVQNYLLVCYDNSTRINNHIAINPKYRALITKVNKQYIPEYNSRRSVKEITVPGIGKYMLL
jgi:hypothetical protein